MKIGMRSVALRNYADESNRIEGIRPSTDDELMALVVFLRKPVSVQSLCDYVKVIQPDAEFRERKTVSGVSIGGHRPIPSGPEVRSRLIDINEMSNAYFQHIAYETLHPFTDGNGRSGRALFLHTAIRTDDRLTARVEAIGFLHTWYYLTLAHSKEGDPCAPIPPQRRF